MLTANFRPSIIIPTLNAVDHLAVLLPALKEQSLPPLEIVVIDSSSEDQTGELAEREECVIEVISREAFDHGSTRNLGEQLSRGDVFFYLGRVARRSLLPGTTHSAASIKPKCSGDGATNALP